MVPRTKFDLPARGEYKCKRKRKKILFFDLETQEKLVVFIRETFLSTLYTRHFGTIFSSLEQNVANSPSISRSGRGASGKGSIREFVPPEVQVSFPLKKMSLNFTRR